MLLLYIDEKGKTVFKGFSFSNTTEGGKSLLEIVKKHSDFTDITVGMEATGHYWLSIYSFLYDYNFYAIHVINPIQTDGWRKGTEIRKRKVICVLDQVFPEYQSIFSNTFGTTSKQLLLDFSSPSDFEEQHTLRSA